MDQPCAPAFCLPMRECLGFASPRSATGSHWKQLVNPSVPALARHFCGPSGALLLGLAAYASAQVWPGGMVVVGWFGLISLTGFALLLLLPYAPRLAVSLPLIGGLIWSAAALA